MNPLTYYNPNHEVIQYACDRQHRYATEITTSAMTLLMNIYNSSCATLCTIRRAVCPVCISGISYFTSSLQVSLSEFNCEGHHYQVNFVLSSVPALCMSITLHPLHSHSIEKQWWLVMLQNRP